MVFFCTSILALKTNEALKQEVKETILKGVDWDKFVVFSTNHYVLPALYIRLKEAELLSFLPTDLVAFMKNLAHLNATRNRKLLEEVFEINALLTSNNITPIFLKGAAHLVSNLYSDYAVRMIGDIDLLVAPNKMIKSAKILENAGYSSITEYNPRKFEDRRHYPRLIHKDKLVAVEVHKDLVKKKQDRQFDYHTIEKTKQQINGVFIPSFENLVIHNAINSQMNDLHYLYVRLNLRQQYDLFLLSKFTDVQNSYKAFGFHQNKTCAYLVKTAFIFQNDTSLEYDKNSKSWWYKNRVNGQLKYPKTFKYINRLIFIGVQTKTYLALIIAHITHPEDRRFVLEKVSSAKWWKEFLGRRYKGMRSN